MKVKIKKYLIVITMVVGMFLSAAIPVSAYTGGAEQETGTVDTSVEPENGSTTTAAPIEEESSDSENSPSDTEEESEEQESAGRVNGTSFSVPGNGQLMDDFSEDETKQFLTIQSKSGNTYFMVLDRSNNTENVYMLSMIDENDLAEFISEEQKEKEQSAVVIPEKESPAVSAEPEKEPVVEEKKGGINTRALLVVILLLTVGIGGFYYFKVIKLRQDEDEADGEDLEFYDGGAYINEDQEDSDEEEE
ncbi:DUF4366 domain-containing protein [Lachnospiraceae bacterium MD308]|nr:DUF4366 domain-containing protein [Lachnospiraceae bacterium MD308]